MSFMNYGKAAEVLVRPKDITTYSKDPYWA